MSNMKNGLTTLNRWLGKKNKDKATPNGKLSKSQTNLSVSNTNINETSQLEYNRITPLPVVTSNAPFEQTFRITVLLPKDQLYVARLGARVPLSKLLELVCENKQLEPQKYEFRNPVDPSQVYSCDLTIGAVGLSEVRLCHKSEAYDNFNPDEVIKLHRTSIIRDSLSSSEFSSRNSKHTTKTASPYSSSNSLNSMDSTGVNSARTTTPPVGPTPPLPTTTAPKMMAPPRKKRAAPRPPSQTAIPERSALIITSSSITNNNNNMSNGHETPATPNGAVLNETMPMRKDFYVSAPNLASSTMLSQSSFSIDCNGNSKINHNYNDDSDSVVAADTITESQNGSQVEQKNARNLYRGSVQNLSAANSEVDGQKFPEPSPRKRILQIKKKVAPAPPPRGTVVLDETYTIQSEGVEISSTHETSTEPESATTQQEPALMNGTQEITAPAIAISTPETQTTPEISATPEIQTSSRVSTRELAPFETPAIPETPAVPKASANNETFASELAESRARSLSQTALNMSPDKEPPKPLAREISLKSAVVASEELTKESQASPVPMPKPVPRITTITTTTTIVNATQAYDSESTTSLNISKIMLNRTPTPEPRSLSTEPPLSDINAEVTSIAEVTSLMEEKHLLNGHNHLEDDDNVSKQADSGIGEPVPSPIPDSLPSEGSNIEGKLSTFESSSDDDDMVKVYNFKLGKTLFQPLDEHQSIVEDMSLVSEVESTSVDDRQSIKLSTETTSIVSETASWSFQIPISPPPNFADSAKSTTTFQLEKPDAPITPNIKERPVLDFGKITDDERKSTRSEEEPRSTVTASKPTVTPLPSPQTPITDIVDELSAIIKEQRMGTIIKKTEESLEIESAKPNTLSNFCIGSLGQQSAKSPEPEVHNIITPSSPESATDEEKLYRKRSTLTNNTKIQRRSITRADSFHTTMQDKEKSSHNQSVTDGSSMQQGLGSRSTSQLSLNKLGQNEVNLQRRRSSSELSIGESPSLQSLEIIKTILNSRKNSINSSGSDSESKTVKAEYTNGMEQTTKVTASSVTTGHQSPAEHNSINDRLTNETSSEPPRKVNEINVKLSEEVEKPAKELPKVYRYSGPPSINLSTWSERPKAQVSIKNEGDYIFGGKNANSPNAAVTKAAMDLSNSSAPPRNYRASVPAEDFRDFKFRSQRKPLQSDETNEVASSTLSTTMRMGIPEKEYKVPVAVKPLEDVVIESVELRVNSTKTESTPVTKHAISTATLNLNGNSVVKQNGRSMDATTPRPLTQYGNNTTLPRNGTAHARFSMPATGQTLLRSTSITQLESNKPKLSSVEIEIAAPFGQNTLRKTGFKEKMLAKEARDNESTVNSTESNTNNAHDAQKSNSTQNSATTHSTQNSISHSTQNSISHSTQNSISHSKQRLNLAPQLHMSQKSPNKTLQSAKLELKLQKSTSVYVNQALNSPTAISNTQVSPKSPTVVTLTTPPPPPPPTPLNLKPVVKRSQSRPLAATPTADPRDQLLEAICNFKREELNRA